MVETAHRTNARTYAGLGYNWQYLARKHRLTKDQAQLLIRKIGHDRDKLNAAAEALRAGETA